jgi:hypothetical protein
MSQRTQELTELVHRMEQSLRGFDDALIQAKEVAMAIKESREDATACLRALSPCGRDPRQKKE